MKALLLADKYLLLRKLGSGGMAEVYLAKQIGLKGFEKLVVIKRILPHLANKKEFVQMFLEEAMVAADLRHQNVIHTFEVLKEQGTYFLAMEYLHGQSVKSLYQRCIRRKSPMPHVFAIGIAMDICSGLYYAHNKKSFTGEKLSIVHQDISPANIVVSYAGETKIVDFGIAKTVLQKTPADGGLLRGKYSYMSPEQAKGEQVDHRSDVFSLGVLLYELTTGRRLFKREDDLSTLRAVTACKVPAPSNYRDDYPKSLETLVLTALQKQPCNRFSDCQEFRSALEGILLQHRLIHSPPKMGAFMRHLFRNELLREKNQLQINAKGLEQLVINRNKSRRRLPHYILGIFSMFGGALGVLMVAFLFSAMPMEPSFGRKARSLFFTEDSWSSFSGRPIKKALSFHGENGELMNNADFGELMLEVSPWAEVYIEDEYLGRTPIVRRLLPAGKHTLRLENNEFPKSKFLEIEIEAGRATPMYYKW